MATVRKFIYKFNAIPITIPTEEMNKLILKQSWSRRIRLEDSHFHILEVTTKLHKLGQYSVGIKIDILIGIWMKYKLESRNKPTYVHLIAFSQGC